MVKNYILIAWRNLLKNKTFSLINIVGLATGLCCFLLIALYVSDELNYDRYNEKADRIFRINSDITFGGTELKLAVTSDPMGAALKNDYPEVEQFVRIYNSNGSKLVKKGTQFIEEQNVTHADSTLFEVFTLPAIHGDIKNALNEPNTVVITESTAKKYFSTTDAVGKVIEINTDNNPFYKVTAVIKDIPKTSHFNFDFIFSMDNVDYGFGNFVSHNFQSYLLLRRGTNYHDFEKYFSAFTEKYVAPQAKQFMQVSSMAEFEKTGNKLSYTLIPVTDIHLHSDRSAELSTNGDIKYVYIFSAVAMFILLIACINFMNLSTARSAKRAKEVGIRKVLGTEKASLVWQFLTESTLTAFIALLLALGMAFIVLPYFNELSTKSLSLKSLFSANALPLLVCLPFIVGILAGSYPAFYLSSFKPIKVLKGSLNTGFKKSNLRSSLVVIQFVTSIILIVATIVIYSQLNFIQTTKIGFDKEQVLVVNGTHALGNNADAFKSEVSKLPGVVSSTFSGYLPVSNSSRSDNSYSTLEVMDSKSGFNMQSWLIDYNYLPTMGMELLKGRNFSKDFGGDSSAVIINESTARLLNFADPIGRKIYRSTGSGSATTIPLTIVGVVKNFHFESLHHNVGPLCFQLGNSSWSTAFKLTAANVQPLLKVIESKWKGMAPTMPFNYQFLDESFDQMYRAEQRVGKLAMTFSILAILIACLGLFGLATYIAEQRTKEIGVRKVLGATVTNLVTMLSKDFLKLVCIATVFAFPLAWYAMHKWLQDFAFRISINWWVFALAAFTALLVALVTISFQAIKAALANPVKSLRTE